MSKVTGFRETARAIRKVAQRPKISIGAGARKALAPMLHAAKSNLKAQGSYHRGVLYRSLKIRRLKSTTSLQEWVLTPTDRGVGIAHLVELGTRPHWQPRRGFMHPGADAKPFMEPAFQQNDDEAIRILAKELGEDLIRYAASVGYRGR